MSTFKEKHCREDSCNNIFVPTGPAAKFCPGCSDYRRKMSSRDRSQRHRIRHGLVQKPGVGKGGNNAKGIDDCQYKSGIASFQTEKRAHLKNSINECNRCSKNLCDAGRYEWCVHHKDHDRTNNEYDNLELLCKRCHQIEHECHKAFESAETIP